MLTVLEKVDLLQKAKILASIPTESLTRVAAIAQEVSFEARQLLFSEKDAADAMFVLLEGEVALLRKGQQTQKVVPPEGVGILALLAGDSQPESAMTTQPVRALRIDQQDLYDAMVEDFNITRGILRALVGFAAGGA